MSTDLAQIEQCNGMIERANQQLAEAHTAQQFDQLIREAEAARVLARQVKLGEAAVNHAQAVKLRAEIRLADVIDGDPQIAHHGDNQHTVGGSGSEPPKTTLADLGVNKVRLHEARELRTLAPTSAQAEERVLEEANRATAQGRELSRSGLINLAREPRRVEAKETHQRDVEEMRDFARSITPDDYDPVEDRHSAAVQRAILAAVDGIKHLDAYEADDVRDALNHSNPKVRSIVLPAYTDHLRTIIGVADRFRELL